MDNIGASDGIKIEESNPKKNSIIKYTIISVLLIASSVGATYLFLKKDPSSETFSKTITSTKMCEDTKIVFFPGGNETDSFASVVYNGAKAAENDLGATIEYVWSDWDSTKMVNQFIDTIAKSPDAIAIMGHPGSDVLGPLVDEAVRKNIIVTSQNVDLPNIREKYASRGFGYVGQILYDSGLMVSRAIVRKYNPTQGDEAIVFGVSQTASPSRYQRTKGNVDGLKGGGLVVHEVTIPVDVEKKITSPLAEKMISDAIKEFPRAKIIITDHGSLTAAAPMHLKNLGISPGEKIVAGYDLSTDTVAGIKSGYLDLILDQQPYLQGYLPILQVCLTKKYGFAGLNINTGIGLVDKSNVDIVSDLAENKIR